MATQPAAGPYDLDEQQTRIRKMDAEIAKALSDIQKTRVDIDKTRVDIDKVLLDARVVSFATIFQGLIAVAALLGAGAAMAKLFFP